MRSRGPAALLLVLALGLAGYVAGRARPRGRRAEAPASGPARVLAPAPDPPAPHRVRRDGVGVPLESGNPREAWLMRETAPLVEPDAEPRPITVLFHSICYEPTWTCDWLQYSEVAPQWQICPRAPTPCAGDGYRWGGGTAEIRRLVDVSMATLVTRHDGRVVPDRTVLAGFSNGAYAVAALVRDLARHPDPSLGVRGVVLFGAEAHVAAADARALGLRVGFTAGDLDGAALSMRREIAGLRAQGIEARFVSLGKVGHFIPVETATAVGELVDWARGE
jgi:hypothetical protein